MTDLGDILRNITKEYKQAIDNMSKENSQLKKFNQLMTKMVDPNSEEYEIWTSRVRATAYGSATGITVGMIVADILGCLGFCSGIVTSTTWGTAVAATESAIVL